MPLFDMLPLVIEQPDQPLGTHVFTAMEVTENGGGMRWNVMTMPAQASAAREQRDTKKRSKALLNSAPQPKPPATSAEALDRIQMPQEAVERIGELLISRLVARRFRRGARSGNRPLHGIHRARALVWRFRSPHHSRSESEMRTSEPKPH